MDFSSYTGENEDEEVIYKSSKSVSILTYFQSRNFLSITFTLTQEWGFCIEGMDKLIGAVDSQRAGLGALQNNRHTLWF